MTCLYYAVSEQCRRDHGAKALKIGFSLRGREVRAKGLREQGYGGYKDWKILNCEFFRREGLDEDQLKSLEEGVFGCLIKAGYKRPCPGADEIVLVPISEVIGAFQWVKREVKSGRWDYSRRRQSWRR